MSRGTGPALLAFQMKHGGFVIGRIPPNDGAGNYVQRASRGGSELGAHGRAIGRCSGRRSGDAALKVSKRIQAFPGPPVILDYSSTPHTNMCSAMSMSTQRTLSSAAE